MTDLYAADRQLSDQHAAVLAEKLSYRSDVLIFDENLQEMGFVNDYLELRFEASIDGSGGLTSTVPRGTSLAPELITRDPNKPLFITAQTATYRWSGVVQSSVPRKDKGSATVIDIIGNPLLTRLDYVSLWKSPTRPLQSQPTDAQVRSGNAVTVVKELAAANIARIQGNLSWPIHVVPNYLPTDESPFVVIESDMQPMGKAFLEALDGTGVALMMWLWMPGDPLVPGGENFDRPTMVLDVVDKGNHSGWSSSNDEAIQQYYRVLTGGGFVAEWLPRPTPISSPLYEAGYSGTDNDAPWVEWDLDGPGVESWSMPTVYATCPTVIRTGLRRGWLQEVMSSLITPPATGLDSPVLYDSLTDADRRVLMGALGAGELVITGTNGEDLATALYESRGYRYLTVSVINGGPYIFGYHFGLGDGQAFSSAELPSDVPGELGGRFFDAVTKALYEDLPTVRCGWSFIVGDGKNEYPPAIRVIVRLRRNFELLSKQAYTDTKAVSFTYDEPDDDE